MSDESPYRTAALIPSSAEERARAALSRDVASYEEVLWVGQPAQGLILQKTDLIKVPFMTLWTAFACFWEYEVLSQHAPLLFCLWGVPFIAIGLYMLVGRFFVDAQRRGRTFYGITAHRALLLEEGATRKLTAIDLDRPGELHLDERADGSGTITFGRPASVFERSSAQKPPALVGIADARRVYTRIREIQATTRARATER